MNKKKSKQPDKYVSSVAISRLILVILLVCLSLGIYANPRIASKLQIGLFRNSKTCVVLESGSISYNIFIKDAVQKHWKSTEFEFIDQEKFESLRHDPQFSFIVLLKGVYDKDPAGISYSYLSLVLGDPAYDVDDMPELCSFPLFYTGDIDNDYGYVIPAMVKFMQKHVNNLESHPLLIKINGLKYYNSMTSFKDKVLLLDKNSLASDADSPEKINTVYPYYIKILNGSEIQTELDANPVNTVFNFHVGPTDDSGSGKCFEMIFDTEGFLWYYTFRPVTNTNEDGLNLNDFNHLR